MRRLIFIPLFLLCVTAFGQFTKPQLYNGINTNIRNKSASQLRLAAMLDSIVVSISTGGSGTVTSLSVTTANGFSGTVSNPTTTPAITLSLQDANGSQSGRLTSTDWTTFNNKLNLSGSNANTDIDIGNYNFNARGIRITGTGGNGDLHLKHQSADATATGSSSALWADVNGNINWKIDGGFKSVFSTSANTGNRIYTLPDASVTLASSLTLVSNATDANFTATLNGVHNILDGVATANRVITIPTGANGDVLKFYNTEDTYVWSFTGATVYLADRVTVVTELLYNVPCFIEKIDGLWIITN